MNHQAAGCAIYKSDVSNIIYTIAACFCFFTFGAIIAGFGSAIPQIAEEIDESETKFSSMFAVRGIGYCVGTLASAATTEIKRFYVPKMLLVSLGALVSGISIGVFASTTDMDTMMGLIFLQGLGFGAIDTLANILIPELWGRRAQPWMQLAHSQWGVAGVIGPVLVGKFGYKRSFLAFFATSFIPITITVTQDAVFYRNQLYLFFAPQPHVTTQSRVKQLMSDPYASIVDDDETRGADAGTTGEGDVGSVIYDKSPLASSAPNSSPPPDPASLPFPLHLKISFSVFYWLYVGAEVGYGGWVASYVLLANLSTSKADAAYATSVFYAMIAAGRLAAIPLSAVVSTSNLVRMQLTLCFIGGILLLTVSHLSYNGALVCAGFIGLAFSSLFPLVMTLVGDYKFEMDARTTTMFVVGATLGEATIPSLIGYGMKTSNAESLNIALFTIIVLMIGIYVVNHVAMLRILHGSEALKTHHLTELTIVSDQSSVTKTSYSFDVDDGEGEGGSSGDVGGGAGHRMHAAVEVSMGLGQGENTTSSSSSSSYPPPVHSVGPSAAIEMGLLVEDSTHNSTHSSTVNPMRVEYCI